MAEPERVGAAVSSRSFTLAELAERLDVSFAGDGETRMSGLGSLETAQPGEISHLSSPAYRQYLATTRASAVILSAGDAEVWAGPALIAANPYLIFARVSQLFATPPEPIRRNVRPVNP